MKNLWNLLRRTPDVDPMKETRINAMISEIMELLPSYAGVVKLQPPHNGVPKLHGEMQVFAIRTGAAHGSGVIWLAACYAPNDPANDRIADAIGLPPMEDLPVTEGRVER